MTHAESWLDGKTNLAMVETDSQRQIAFATTGKEEKMTIRKKKLHATNVEMCALLEQM